ncbi:hypothetical protein KAX75_05040 [candidate division WOR-3 bacterium]|nr:hypothetical protein [candidate division WOR-3 bacterium]
MICLKLGVLLIVVLIYVFQFVLDYKYPDKRTKRNKSIRISLLVLFIVLLGISAVMHIFEERKATKLVTEISGLRLQNDSLIVLHHKSQEDASKNTLSLLARIDTLESNLEPFIEIAVSKYPNLVVERALKKLELDIAETKAMAKPNTLSYSSVDINKTEKGYVVRIDFRPRKDEPIGQLIFVAKLPINSKARILDFDQSRGSAADWRRWISTDGKFARLSYTPMGGGDPGVNIVLSDTAHISFEGNKGLDPRTIHVK